MSYVESYDWHLRPFGQPLRKRRLLPERLRSGAAQGVPGVGITDPVGQWRSRIATCRSALGAQKPYTKASGLERDDRVHFLGGKAEQLFAGSAPINREQCICSTCPSRPTTRCCASTAVPRHRLVRPTPAIFVGHFSLAGKLELATPIPASCIYVAVLAARLHHMTQSVGGNRRLSSAGKPDNFLGYKDLDLQLTKNFTFFHCRRCLRSRRHYERLQLANYDPGSRSTSGGAGGGALQPDRRTIVGRAAHVQAFRRNKVRRRSAAASGG